VGTPHGTLLSSQGIARRRFLLIPKGLRLIPKKVPIDPKPQRRLLLIAKKAYIDPKGSAYGSQRKLLLIPKGSSD
jgi:hypothetical protein